LLDHGSVICRSEKPQCDICVLRDHCAAAGGIASAPQLSLPTGANADAA
jgi:adenine-specific DNA glycosylase